MSSDPGGGDAPHVLPAQVLLGTAAALLALTAVTVAVSRVDLGPLNLLVALAIAGAKAALVAAFFMHLRYQRPLLTGVLVSAVLFAVVLVGLVAFDTVSYQPDIREAQAATRARPGGQPPAGGR